MRTITACLSPLMLLFISNMACKTDNTPFFGNTDTNNSDTISNHPGGGSIRIRVGTTTFSANLLDNATVTAFKARLPITVSMNELNGNEKYYSFPTDFPTNASTPGMIQTGDLLLYGSSTLVLFYKSFSTSYSYTKLGRVDNPAGLAAALGSGNVTVTFDRPWPDQHCAFSR